MSNVDFPPLSDLQLRWKRIQDLMREENGDACLFTGFVALYYLTGKMFDGYIYLTADEEPVCFVRKPVDLLLEGAVFIRKPEEIPDLLRKWGKPQPRMVGLEADQLTYNEYIRLQKLFEAPTRINATTILRRARMVKTPWEVEQLRYSARQHSYAYKKIPSLFEPGMTDLEFQYGLEANMRQHGSIGIFRTFGSNMDIFMGSVLTGDNAAKPSPCDFALGGAGCSALPIGANGSLIRKGQAVMIDLAGNFTAYVSDMTRVYAYGTLSDEAYRAHEVSIDMNNWLSANGKPGLSCKEIYEQSLAMAEEAGFLKNFMGTLQQARFVGHGVGIEINELPVLTERSKDKLEAGMVFAYEPKFVLPTTGAVGIENTFLVTEKGIEKLTIFEEGIIPLDY